MARSQRRQRTPRSTHESQTATVSGRDDATQLLSTDDWHHLTETLDGLLRIEFPSPFTNLELLCPKEAWLVVDLARVRAPTAAAPSLRHQLAGVLASLSRLLIHAETLRPWDNLYEKFWRRVLVSEMFDQDQIDNAVVRGFVRFAKAKGSHVALQWRGRGLESNQVVGPLAKWLHTAVDESKSTCFVPVRVALRFEDCELTVKHLKQIHQKLLTMPPARTAVTRLLFEASALRELSLSGNILHTHVLHALAAIIEDPATRRIDGLHLDSTVPSESHQTPAYTAAFGRVMTAMLATKDSVAQDVEDGGVSLSLEDCTIYHAAHVDALATALVQATRPFRKLSLACWHLEEEDASVRFARLLHTPLPTARDDFDLNVSGIRSDWAESERVRSRVLKDAFAAGQRLSCRLVSDAWVSRDGERLPLELSTTCYYDVVTVGDCQDCGGCGYCVIWIAIPTTDGLVAAITGRVDPNDIADVRVHYADGASLLTKPRGLIVDQCARPACGRADRSSCNNAMLWPASMVGTGVTRLSMRNNQWVVFDSNLLGAWCANLEELNVRGCRDAYHAALGREIARAGHSLQALNAADCGLDASTLRSVLAFPHLQNLGFAFNKTSATGLESLADDLEGCHTLRYVDLRHVRHDPESDSAIGHRLETLFLHARTRQEALQLVIDHVETTHGLSQSLPSEVTTCIVCIVSFLNTRPTCELLW